MAFKVIRRHDCIEIIGEEGYENAVSPDDIGFVLRPSLADDWESDVRQYAIRYGDMTDVEVVAATFGTFAVPEHYLKRDEE